MEATLIKPDYTALKERVSLVRTRLTMECPFFGWLALKVQPVVVGGDHPVKTAGITRDRTMFLNADFCAAQTDAQLAGLVCHEVLHLAYLCFERQGSRNAMVLAGIPHTVEAGETLESISALAGVTVEDLLLANNLPEGTVLQPGQEITVGSATVSLWNIAHDYVINRMIEAFGCSGIQLPPGGLLDSQWDNHAAEEVYDSLLEKMAEDRRGQGKGQPGKKGESGLSPSWGA